MRKRLPSRLRLRKGSLFGGLLRRFFFGEPWNRRHLPSSLDIRGGRVSVINRRDRYQVGGKLEINDTLGIVQGGIMLQ